LVGCGDIRKVTDEKYEPGFELWQYLKTTGELDLVNCDQGTGHETRCNCLKQRVLSLPPSKYTICSRNRILPK